MTRKEQALARQLENAINITMKSLSKERSWNKKDWAVFKSYNFLFYRIMVWNGGSFNKIEVDIQCKPFKILDELFWDIVNMQENKNQPVSFHAVGVYTAPLAKLFDRTIVINFPAEDVTTLCTQVFDDCTKIVEKYNKEVKDLSSYKLYIQKNKKTCYQSEISIILIEIALGNIQHALKLIEQQIKSKNKDMFFYHAQIYCKKLSIKEVI